MYGYMQYFGVKINIMVLKVINIINCNLTREKTGVRSGDLLMSFNSIFQDVRNAVDWMHVHVIYLHISNIHYTPLTIIMS